MSNNNLKTLKRIKKNILFVVIPIVVLFSLLVGVYLCFPESNFSLKIKEELWLRENYRNAKNGVYDDNPTVHPNTRWVCQEVDMYFDHIESDDYEYEGAITINGKTQKIYVSFHKSKHDWINILTICRGEDGIDCIAAPLYFGGSDGVMTVRVPHDPAVSPIWDYDGDLTFVMEELPTDLVNEANTP